MRRFPTTVDKTRSGTYAVMLNINARGVNRRVRETIRRVVPEENLFISRTREEADGHASTIIARRYDGVFSGGGDGSLVMLINLLWKHVMLLNSVREQAQRAAAPAGGNGAEEVPYHFPLLGILKLGTGNGWAGVVGSRRGVDQLRHALTGGTLKFTPFELIEAEGRRFHFSGLGWDAAILNDYIEFKKLGERYPPLKKYITTLPGYLTSVFCKTIPQQLWRQFRGNYDVKCKVINRGPRIFRLEGGRPVPVRFGRGDMIFHGPVNIVGVATTPNYGFNMKAFPFAMTMPGMMNLRVVQAGVTELVLNMGPIWEGTYRSPRIRDFLVSDVEIQTSEPMPFHIGGDAEGRREQVRYRIAREGVNVLDFSLS